MAVAETPRPEYRRARFADLAAIAAIEAEVFAEPYLYLMLRQLYDLHGRDWVVVEIEGAIIGYALPLEEHGRALIFTFAVVKEYQRAGYGRALLNHTLHMCRELGAYTVYLTVRPDNVPAGRLFKQAGFCLSQHDEEYFGPGEPRDVYEYRFD